MLESIKDWWKTVGQEFYGVLAVITVVLTIMFYVFALLGDGITWVVSSLGLAWAIRIWIAIAFGYIAYELALEIVAFKRDPQRYGTWDDDIDDE